MINITARLERIESEIRKLNQACDVGQAYTESECGESFQRIGQLRQRIEIVECDIKAIYAHIKQIGIAMEIMSEGLKKLSDKGKQNQASIDALESSSLKEDKI